jgi:hypothetical protein
VALILDPERLVQDAIKTRTVQDAAAGRHAPRGHPETSASRRGQKVRSGVP